MLWQDQSGAKYLERTVSAGEDDSLEEANARGGTYWQALTFSFWFFNHDVASHCLNATLQRPGGEVLDRILKAKDQSLPDARLLAAAVIVAGAQEPPPEEILKLLPRAVIEKHLKRGKKGPSSPPK